MDALHKNDELKLPQSGRLTCLATHLSPRKAWRGDQLFRAEGRSALLRPTPESLTWLHAIQQLLRCVAEAGSCNELLFAAWRGYTYLDGPERSGRPRTIR